MGAAKINFPTGAARKFAHKRTFEPLRLFLLIDIENLG